MSIFRDIVTFGGLVSVGVGLWWIEPAYSLIGVGGVLFLTGFVWARRG